MITQFGKPPWALLAMLCLMGLASPGKTAAVTASPHVHTIFQPDGSTFQALQWGDEYSHGWETVSGHTIVFDEILDAWTYAVTTAERALANSSTVVEKGGPPPDFPKALRPSVKPTATARKAASARASMPSTGVAGIPVILVNFSDTTPTYSASDFETLLFGDGMSLKNYYEEVSYGKFKVSSGPEGIAGWFKAKKPHDYYGEGEMEEALVLEAVAKADAAGFDFSTYDRDGDCVVDIVAVVHQGAGEEASGDQTDIWSHRFVLTPPYITNTCCPADPSIRIKVIDYVTVPEIQDGAQKPIGTLAHELGHSLGLRDLYDTDHSSSGAGRWSLMASGDWLGTGRYGNRPAHLDPWSKYRLGWIDPKLVVGALYEWRLEPSHSKPDIYQLMSGGPLTGEYFLVEYRRKGGFDEALPGEGLLIWHIDGEKIASKMGKNGVNTEECTPPLNCSLIHYGVSVEQADGRFDLEEMMNEGDADDPYPGYPLGKSVFTHESHPDAMLYAGSRSPVNISAIHDHGTYMTATLSVDNNMPHTDFDEWFAHLDYHFPDDITTGPDGNLWVTDDYHGFGRITPEGESKWFRIITGTAYMWQGRAAAGPDGNVWRILSNPPQISALAKITPSEVVTLYNLPTSDHYLYSLTAGKDGNIWFTDFSEGSIGRMFPTGEVTEYPSPTAGASPKGITAGPDGNVWYTTMVGFNSGTIGRITPQADRSEWPLPANIIPGQIATGPDGNLWFDILDGLNYQDCSIGRFTPEGLASNFPTPVDCVQDITAGPDGNMWFISESRIGQVTMAGQIQQFTPPSFRGENGGITRGPDRNIYYTDRESNRIGKLLFEKITVPPAPSGKASSISGESFTFTTSGAKSSLDHPIEYLFDWDDGSTSHWIPADQSNQASTDHEWGKGTYRIRVMARCADHPAAVSGLSSPKRIFISASDETMTPPTTPDGPATGATGTPYTFSTGGAWSSDGEPVQYRFDWGDGTKSAWLPTIPKPVTAVKASHKFCSTGYKNVKAEARSTVDFSMVSCFSSPRPIRISASPPAFWSLEPPKVSSPVGATQVLQAIYMALCGSPALKSVQLLVNETKTVAGGIRVEYRVDQNRLKMYNNAGTRIVGSCTPGIAGSLSNGQGTLNCLATQVGKHGGFVTVKWSITPKKAFASTAKKNIYMCAADMAGEIANWKDLGDWTINR